MRQFREKWKTFKRGGKKKKKIFGKIYHKVLKKKFLRKYKGTL